MSSSTKRGKKTRTTILFLAANSEAQTKSELGQEARDIEEGLQQAELRSQFRFEPMLAVTSRDILPAIRQSQPRIVHFAGKASKGGLAFYDKAGKSVSVNEKQLGSIFELFTKIIECVVLNGCYSEVQAEAIAQHIPYVVGVKQEAGSAAALEFAVGFYSALGAGESIENAFNHGRATIRLAGIEIPDDLTQLLHQVSTPSPSVDVNQRRETSASNGAQSSSIFSVPAAIASDLQSPPEGSVSIDSPLYVERPPNEEDCRQAILNPGALIRIRAPRQMGKTSLMQRILHHARQQGHQTAYINLQSFDSDSFDTLDNFLLEFCASVTNELNLEEPTSQQSSQVELSLSDQLSRCWEGVLGSKNKCSNYFQRHLLTKIPKPRPLTLGLDEVDQVFHQLEMAQDFFGLLRSWHEKGKNEATWQRLRLIIAHSREVYIPLNINHSPFNVGLAIELPELNVEQVTDLVQRHGAHWSTAQIQQLMDMVGGHPYLLRKALYEIVRGKLTLERFTEIAPTEEGLYSDHLRRHLENLQSNPSLAVAMWQVVTTNAPTRIDAGLGFQLYSMGLVKQQGNDVLPLCNLYRIYFRDRLNNSSGV